MMYLLYNVGITYKSCNFLSITCLQNNSHRQALNIINNYALKKERERKHWNL